MAGEWRDSTLGEVTDFLSGGTPSKSRADYWNGSIPWVSAKDMKQFRLKDSQDHVTEGGASNGTRLAPAGSVLLLVRGMTLLNDLPICVISKPMTFNQDVKALRPNANVTDDFLPYLLLGNKDRLLSRVDLAGHGTGRLNSDELKALEIALPPKAEQRAIAHILSTLDDKIELNRRRNQTLEAMARALFKDWFVDFGPVLARMEGREPYLPIDLWRLFPDRLDDEGKPEGWELRPVGDFAELKGGKQLERDRITTSGLVPVFGGAGVMGYTEDHNADGFVISVGRVGAYCGQFFSHRGKAWINNNASLIRQIDEGHGEWLFLSLSNADINVIKKGAAQPFVSNGDIAKLPLVWPGNEVVREFSKIAIPQIRKKERNEAESESLAQLRDTLLPKLISGELRIADAEKFIERAECQTTSQAGSVS